MNTGLSMHRAVSAGVEPTHDLADSIRERTLMYEKNGKFYADWRDRSVAESANPSTPNAIASTCCETRRWSRLDRLQCCAATFASVRKSTRDLCSLRIGIVPGGEHHPCEVFGSCCPHSAASWPSFS